MTMKIFAGLLTITVTALFVAYLAATAVEPVQAGSDDSQRNSDELWTSLSYEQAKQSAAENDRILLVYATASWCGPCQHMERTTWVDPTVAAWFDEHGLAFKFDVDENRELSRSLRVRAMPTLIAYRDGKAFDQIMGARSAEDLIEWLDGVKQGKSELGRLREAAGDRADEDGHVDVQGRLTLARMLVDRGEFEEATDEFVWLWSNMLDHEPAMVGVRGSFMISDMSRLADRHPQAKEAFRELRAAYWPAIEAGTADQQDLQDWLTLAEPADESDTLMPWFDQAKEDERQRALLPMIAHLLHDRLVAEDRWSDLAILYPQPVQSVRRELQRLAMFEDENDIRETMVRMARRNAAGVYVAMLASGREEEASNVAELLLNADDSPRARQALVSHALRAGEVRTVHVQWLDEALEQGHHVRQLRREVAEALADRQT